MRKLLLVAIAVLALTAVLPAAPASARKSCGTVTKTYSYGSYTFAIYVLQGRAACKTARAVMRVALERNRQPKRWRCFTPPTRRYDKVCGRPKDSPEDHSRAIGARLEN